MATSKKFSELPAASSVGNGDLFAIAHEDALAETGYVSQKLTAAQAGQKVNGDTEYPTGLPSFPTGSQNPFDALEKLNTDIEALYPVNTASGSIANFTTSLSKPLVALSSTIVAQQAGSGTPSPQNERSISGFSSVKFVQTGKNIFNPSISSRIGTSIQGWALNDTNIVSFFNWLPEGNYNLSFKVKIDIINGTSTSHKYGVVIDNSESGTIDARYTTTTPVAGAIFTLSVNVNITSSNVGKFTNFWFYCGRSWADTPDNCTFYDFQLEVGNTQTTYESYNADTFTIQLGQTVYGGVVDAVNGKLIVDKELVTIDENNTFLISSQTSTTATIRVSGFTLPTGTADITISNRFDTSLPSGTIGKYSVYGTTYLYFVVDITELSSVDAAGAKAWFLANQTDVLILKSAVEEIDITANNFTAFAGENNIFTDCGEASVSFKQGIQEYIDAKIAETQALIL